MNGENLLPNIAEMLGVNLYEEFMLRESVNGVKLKLKYRISMRGLEYFHPTVKFWRYSEFLVEILCGFYTIVKIEEK